MSGAVRAAANEPGFLQICVSRWPALGVEEGVSSALSFSCGWSLPEAFPRENSLTLIKCELTPKPFPQSGYLPGFSPAYFHELFIALWRPPVHHEICCQSRGLGAGAWIARGMVACAEFL